MKRKTAMCVGLALLIASAVLGAIAYQAQERYMKAERRTMSLSPGQTGPLRPDTQIRVELFGPNRRAADQAKTNRNTLISLAIAAGISGLVFMSLGVFRKEIVAMPK